MKLTIEQVNNGYILRVDDCEDSRTLVFSTDERLDEKDNQGEINSCVSLLWNILDLIGPSTSRYSPSRIYIDVRPGDKYEDSVL